MRRFFFDLTDNGQSFPDTEGTELPGLDVVEDEASMALLEIARDKMPDGPYRELAFRVRDEADTRLFLVKVTYELLRETGDE
jgi:hypothetical protein